MRAVAGGGGTRGMLSFAAAIKAYLYTVACGVRWRRGFDGLSMMAEHSSFATCSVAMYSHARAQFIRAAKPVGTRRRLVGLGVSSASAGAKRAMEAIFMVVPSSEDAGRRAASSKASDVVSRNQRTGFGTRCH